LPTGETVPAPAADVAAYLTASRGDNPERSWMPAPLPALPVEAIDELAAALGVELPVGALDDEKLAKLGSTVIARRGCTGCHDLPVDDGPPIGPELTGWASKHRSELAFERVVESSSLSHPHATFAELKLEAPRRFDYALADKKPYRDWLRMGRFPTRARESDAIVTFLLSLTADPPPPRYIATPDARQQTIIAGRRLVDELSCEACHAFDLDRWRLSFKPGAILPPPPHTDWPLVEPQFTPEQVAASLAVDPQGERRAEVVGMPRIDRDGGLLEDEDDEGEPVYFFTPWEPSLVDGHVWAVGGADIIVPKAAIGRQYAPRGGDWTRRMYPRVLADAQAAGATAAEMEAWGWLPPALHDVGARLQPAWLYEFLLRPRVVRPAAVLGMPRYALSTNEAAALADYFAARANMPTGYPSLADPRRPEVGPKLDGAMRILADRTTFCAKCHVIGDAVPTGGRTVLAPDLIEVQRRLRPEHLRRWLASPKSVLPYTAMPVNFPPTGEALGQDLLPGTASEQLDAVMELLLHYDEIRRRSVLDE
jgi:cytochrome c2